MYVQIFSFESLVAEKAHHVMGCINIIVPKHIFSSVIIYVSIGSVKKSSFIHKLLGVLTVTQIIEYFSFMQV